MPYVVICKFVILQLQLVDKDEMLRNADTSEKTWIIQHMLYTKSW